MSLEDRFHRQKAHTWLTVHLRDRHEHDVPVEPLARRAARLEDVVAWVGGGSVDDIFAGTHASIRIADGRVQLDHAKVGGPRFLRLTEALLGASPRNLPRVGLVGGAAQCAYHSLTLARMMLRSPAVDLTSAPLRFLTKRYALDACGVSRRFVAYHAFLLDALRTLRVERLVVGFTVVFDGGAIVNDVGIVLVDVDVGMDARALEHAFRRRAGTSVASNFLSKLGRLTTAATRLDGTSVRRKLDLVVTSLVVDGADDVHVAVQAAGPVYEGAYASLFSRLRADGGVDVLVGVSTHDARWDAWTHSE